MSYRRDWQHCLFLRLPDLSRYKHLSWDCSQIYRILTALKPSPSGSRMQLRWGRRAVQVLSRTDRGIPVLGTERGTQRFFWGGEGGLRDELEAGHYGTARRPRRHCALSPVVTAARAAVLARAGGEFPRDLGAGARREIQAAGE